VGAPAVNRPDPCAQHAGDEPYPQPTPRRFYVHDDLSDEVERCLGPDSPGAALARDLLDLLARDRERVVVLTLAEQVERVVGQGPHPPFDTTVGIGRAGEAVARRLHARAGWFPRITRVEVAREEDARGGYALVTLGHRPLGEQLAGLRASGSLAVVDDTVFSGLTMRGVLGALPAPLLARTRAFCLRGVAESLAELASLCPVTAGVAAPGRLLHDVSFINATGLVRRVAVRRRGQAALAFFDRPEWLRAWFPGYDGAVLDLCRRLNALIEPAAD
jgi:hypothetical protein